MLSGLKNDDVAGCVYVCVYNILYLAYQGNGDGLLEFLLLFRSGTGSSSELLVKSKTSTCGEGEKLNTPTV